jgi:hypothetical protein
MVVAGTIARGSVGRAADGRPDVEPRPDWRAEDFRGKLLLIYFGYSYCTGVCPTDL